MKAELQNLILTYQKNRVEKTIHPYKKRKTKPKTVNHENNNN